MKAVVAVLVFLVLEGAAFSHPLPGQHPAPAGKMDRLENHLANSQASAVVDAGNARKEAKDQRTISHIQRLIVYWTH